MEAKNNDTATVSTWTPLLPENIFTATDEGQAQTLTHTPWLTFTMRDRVTQPTPTLVIPARNTE